MRSAYTLPKQATSEKPIPHIPLPFEEVMKDVLEVRPAEKTRQNPESPNKAPK
jgi:hypothetical protein